MQQQYELLLRIWNAKHEAAGDADAASANTTISRIISKAQEEEQGDRKTLPVFSWPRKRRVRWIKTIAASTAAAAVITAVVWFKTADQDHGAKVLAEKAIVTENGSKTRSLLADGTTVWLNAGSKLYYENDFSGMTREVRLEGEAFFDVTRQPAKPFIVHTGGIDIRVLGTSFNVKSYPEDRNVETTLYKGLVQVFRHEDSSRSTIQLVPNQKLVIPKQAAMPAAGVSDDVAVHVPVSSSSYIITSIDSSKKENERFETAWLYSRLEFRGDSFAELAPKLERWYNVRILFKDELVKELRFNGSFEKESVDQAFHFLREAIPFIYKIDKNEISVESPK